MESTVSVSKGVFVFKNGLNLPKTKEKKSAKGLSFFDKEFISENWYETYQSMWSDIELKIQTLNQVTYNQILGDLVKYVEDCYNNVTAFSKEIIPCATLLTGINQPDHTNQFSALQDQLLSKVTPHVVILYSQDSASIKHVIENMVYNFINNGTIADLNKSMESPSKSSNKQIKKSRCNMSVLQAWFTQLYDYKNKYDGSPLKKIKSNDKTNQLVIIVPDFENFNPDILKDLILILSGYTPNLPFVLIFGVATSVSALHKNFPFQVSSKLYIEVFQSHSSTNYLNKILENVFLSGDCPFHLGEKPFQLLLDIFLFYDFSVTGFIQGIKFCMMEHYYAKKIMSLCCYRNEIKEAISALNDDDLEDIRHLLSFRPYVESQPAQARIDLLTDNEYFKNDLCRALKRFHKYIYKFHVVLKLLLVFVSELPSAPMGKQIRELYSTCISSTVVESDDYQQCIKLLDFKSKGEIVPILKKCINLLDAIFDENLNHKMSKRYIIRCDEELMNVRENLSQHMNALENAGWTNVDIEVKEEEITDKFDRNQLKQNLLKASQQNAALSQYELSRKEFLKYLTEEVFAIYLKPANTQPFYEIFFFNDTYRIKKNIAGTPRASIHVALNNPVTYLQCDCCLLPSDESILAALPDLSLAYKLHLECGKLINLYDWLQAFVTIVDPVEDDDNDEEERRDIPPEIQARFTRAVSELQFLGFIKTSKRKTDHVTRLTW